MFTRRPCYRLLATVGLALLTCLEARAQVAGTVQVGTAPALKLVDGWVGKDCSTSFLNVFLVPYRSPRHELDEKQPYVQVCAWFENNPDLRELKMATLTVHGLGAAAESKYTWNDSRQAGRMLQLMQVQGKKWHFCSNLRAVSSPYPKVAPGTWNLDVSVQAPTPK